MNVITAKPSTEGVFATVGAEVGNRGQLNALGTLNVPVGEKFALRGNFFIEQRDGFADQDSGTKDLEGPVPVTRSACARGCRRARP